MARLYNFLILYFISTISTFVLLFPLLCLYMYRREKESRFGPRLAVFLAVYFLAGLASPLLIQQNPLKNINYSISLAYTLLYAMLFGFLLLCYRTAFHQALFDFIVCYSIKMLLGTIVSLTDRFALSFLPFSQTYLADSLIQFICAGIVYFLLFHFIYSRRALFSTVYEPNTVIVWFCFAIFLATLFLDSGNTNASYNLSYMFITVACYLLIIFIQFGFLERSSLKTDMEINKKIWEEREKQLLITKENLDLISVKCHDIKHFLGLMKQGNYRIPQEEIDRLNEAINVYDSFIETGCDTLDALLTDRTLFARHHNIRLTCIADGSALSFLSTTDIVSLFGNALENAFTAVMQLPEDYRFVSIQLEKVKGMLLINVENPYAGELTVANNSLPTSKGSSAFHGFGIKSMKMIVAKYKGTLSISAEKGIFSLKISIPLK